MKISGTSFGRAAADYGAFRAGFPDSIFDRLEPFGVGLAGQYVVDLGTGTGTLARGFATRGCRVVGIDPDARLLAEAKELDRRAGVTVRYEVARAEATGLEGHKADVVTAGQCWHWFDGPKAVAEVIRLIKPRGKLVIAHFDWLPLRGNVVEATENLIVKYNDAWDMGGGLGMYPQWLPDLSHGEFQGIESFSYDVDVPYPPESWRGRIRASAGISSLDESTVSIFDAELEQLLAAHFPGSVLVVPHRVFAIVASAV